MMMMKKQRAYPQKVPLLNRGRRSRYVLPLSIAIYPPDRYPFSNIVDINSQSIDPSIYPFIHLSYLTTTTTYNYYSYSHYNDLINNLTITFII